jgi:hypothetical protein
VIAPFVPTARIYRSAAARPCRPPFRVKNGVCIDPSKELKGLSGLGAGLLEQGLGAAINKVAFYSAYSQPVEYTGAELAQMLQTGGAPAPSGLTSLIQRVKPTIVIDTPLGQQTIAPFGAADPTEWQTNVRNLILLTLGVLAVFSVGMYRVGLKTGEGRCSR